MKKKIFIILLILVVFVSGCSKKGESSSGSSSSSTSSKVSDGTKLLSSSDIFTERDLEQTADTSSAKTYTVSDGEDITISKEGVYVITGSAKNVTVNVDADDEEKVQLVLDSLTITNDSNPCIYVKNADKVFVTTVGENHLSVTGTFTSDGDTNTDAVIFSKDDIVLNGTGNLEIHSTNNGISSKDDLKITGGTLTIECSADGLEANNAVAIADGVISITTDKDAIHAEYDEDDSVGYVYIGGGEITINADDDAIHATTIVQIDGGTITTTSREGVEGTYIQINGGVVNIKASDDGMNAAQQSKSYTATIEINDGEVTVDMGQGDTDAIDSNGNIYINGGTITINAQSPFDYDGEAKYTGGVMTVNGEETTTITNQMMGGGGQPGGNGGRGRG